MEKFDIPKFIDFKPDIDDLYKKIGLIKIPDIIDYRKEIDSLKLLLEGKLSISVFDVFKGV